MADRAGRRGNRDGINRAILEAGVGSTRTVLETELPKARRCELAVGNVTSSASAIESRTAGTKEGFRGRRAVGEATGVDLGRWPMKSHENHFESMKNGTGPSGEIEFAVEELRLSACLIRSVRG